MFKRDRDWNGNGFDGGRGIGLTPGVQTAQPASASKLSLGCGYGVMVILLAGGLGLLGLASNQYDKAGHRPVAAVVVPGILGALLVLGSGAYLKLARRLVQESAAEDARRAQFPEQPWKWKKKWQAPVIEANTGSGAVMMWVFAIFWNAISMPAAWMILHDPHREKASMLILIFPLVGLLVLWAAIYQTLRWRKFGNPRLVLSTLPGAIGGYLGGVIEVAARVQLEVDAKLALKCLRRVTTGSGKSRSTSEKVLWEHVEHIAREKWVTSAGGTRIPVLFYIPPYCVATDDRDSRNEVVWRLVTEAAVPGVDFATQFDVPVYMTGETAPPPAPGAPLLDEYKAE